MDDWNLAEAGDGVLLEARQELIMTTLSAENAEPEYVPKYPGLQEFSRRYRDVHGYIAVVICILGVIANMANIVVLTRRKMISSTNVILTWLAVADLLTMAIFLPFCLHFYVLRDRRLPFPSTQSAGWIRYKPSSSSVADLEGGRAGSPPPTLWATD